jgi:hypothetical protein
MQSFSNLNSSYALKLLFQNNITIFLPTTESDDFYANNPTFAKASLYGTPTQKLQRNVQV